MVVHAFSPSTQRQAHVWAFQAALVYILSSRLASANRVKTHLKKKIQQNKTKSVLAHQVHLTHFHSFLDTHSAMEILSHMVILCLVLQGTKN